MFTDNKSEPSTDDDSEVSQENNKIGGNQYKPLKGMTKKQKGAIKRILAQTLVTSAVMLSSASCGMPVGYSAILLPQLKNVNDSMQIDDEIGSWIASVHSAATPLGSLVSGLLMDRCGRKLALQIASIPLIIGWTLIGFSPNHGILLLGRLVAGVSAGLTAAAGQVLIGEISEPHLRGMFSSVPFASYSFGILLVYALGTVLQWRYVAVLSAILPISSITFFFFLPESPVWLVRNGKIDQAKRALTWLRGGNNVQVKMEYENIMDRIDKEEQQYKKTSKFSTFFQPEVLKPFLIINMFNVMQILSGTYLIVFYAVDILSHVQNSHFDHFLAAVFTACVRFLFSIVASLLLAIIGRRTLALTSGLGTTLSALCLGTFLHQNCSDSGLVSALLVLIYVATNTVGFMILPGVMLGELLPARIRGLAGGLSFMLFNFVLFAVTKVFPFIKSLVGVYGVFWLFGIASLFATLFLYLLLPETKGRTLNQIEDYFQQSNILWQTRNRKWTKTDDGVKEKKETERLAV